MALRSHISLTIGVNMYTIDFETHKIIKGSYRMPIPVGVSIKENNSPSKYYAFGHLTNNNSTYKETKLALQCAINGLDKILCHNAKFDLRICLEHFDIPLPHWSLINDTMIMAYLIDPREDSLSLKNLALKYCGMPPDDQRELHEWLIIHYPEAKSEPGAYISHAPGDLVGKYAESDTDMTYALYQYFHKHFDIEPGPDESQNIRNAYDREMKLLPIVINLERRGIDIAPEIHQAKINLESKFDLIELQLNAYGDGAKPGSKAMFNILRKKGLIDESKIQYTVKGNPRYGKEFIEDLVSDKELAAALKIRSRLQKFLSTYIRPFAESALEYNGKYYPYYNQTRSEDDYGTRTGRFSSNIQQLPKDSLSGDELPFIRSFIIPSKPGRVIIKRDFSGQEMRVTAHYAEGDILRAYQENPKLDVHSFVERMVLEKTGISGLERWLIKTIGFLKLYGGSAKALAAKIKIPVQKAYEFFDAYDGGLPEFKKLTQEVENMARRGQKIKTWGGRNYEVERPKDGREFYYKLGNVLIQGSSADMTKEAMVRYDASPDRRGELVMTVHDELIAECDDSVESIEHEMNILRWAMDDIPGWDVPLRSDGKFGKSLGEMTEYEDE